MDWNGQSCQIPSWHPCDSCRWELLLRTISLALQNEAETSVWSPSSWQVWWHCHLETGAICMMKLSLLFRYNPRWQVWQPTFRGKATALRRPRLSCMGLRGETSQSSVILKRNGHKIHDTSPFHFNNQDLYSTFHHPAGPCSSSSPISLPWPSVFKHQT